MKVRYISGRSKWANTNFTDGKIYEVIEKDEDGDFWVYDDNKYKAILYMYEAELIEHQQTDTHYNNENGSLYLFAEQHVLNAWEFEVIKRIVRCRKKGEFVSDIEKTKRVLDLYLKEQGELYKDQVEKLNN